MSERWQHYVKAGVEKAGGPVAFALEQWAYLAPMTAVIRRMVPPGGRVLDVGCGSGLFPALLAHHGYQVTGVDNDEQIVGLAVEMGRYLRSAATYEVADAFDLSRWHGRADLVYSLGVVEHFEPEDTVRLIAEQARCAPAVVVVVPSRHIHYCGPPTDERLHSRREWRRLDERTGLRVAESFVFGQVPVRSAGLAARLLPAPLLRRALDAMDLGMNICCVGRR
jgi:SAM-dependent methyltransferase